MSLVAGRAKHLESAIGILLLAILFLIGLSVFIKQSDFDMGRFGIDAASSALTKQKSKTVAEEQLFFDALVPTGFQKLSEAETYVPETLYEKIDGKAPLYIESGFVKLFTQRFASQNDDTLWFEVFTFDMATPKNAFSVYSVQKRPDALPLSLMQFAYSTENAQYFASDRFYVELIGSSESAVIFKAMSEVADKLTERLSESKVTEIHELILFPPDNLVAGSAKLYLSDAFGFDGFSDTFVCQYKIGEDPVTAFLSKCQSTQDARTVAESYYNFLIDNGGRDKPASDKNLQAIKCKVLDFYNTTEIVFAIGPYVAGIHEAKNQQSAEKVAAELFDKLSKLPGQ